METSAKKIIGNVLFIAVLLLIIGRFLSIAAGTPFPLSVVSSDSMEPALFKGDVMPWMPCSIDTVEPGDVVVYASAQSWDNEKHVVHRVTSVRETNGERTLITRGDQNNYTDQAGPHVPEPPITGGMLKGRAIMLGGQPLKIPLAGYPWLMLHSGIDALTRSMSWGQPQPGHHYGVFVPAVIAISLVVAGAVLWAPGRGRNMRETLHDCILGPERLSGRRMFAYIFLFYVVFLMIAASFSYDRLSASMAVDEAAPDSDLSFGTLQATSSSFPRSVSVVNPSMLPVRGMVFASGDIARFLEPGDAATFSLDSGERFSGNITASIPAGTPPGVYTGSLIIYSSPYWSIVPASAVDGLRTWHHRGAIVALTLLAAGTLAVSTFLLLAVLSWMMEKSRLVRGYLAWRLLPVEARMPSSRLYTGAALIAQRLRRSLRRTLSWLDTTTGDDDAPMRPIAVSLVGLLAGAPLLYWRHSILAALLVASIVGGIAAYLVGCRWRSQFLYAALLTTGWLAGMYAAVSMLHVVRAGGSLFVPLASSITTAGVMLLLYAALAVPSALLFWLPGHVMHSIREKWNPVVLLRGCDL